MQPQVIPQGTPVTIEWQDSMTRQGWHYDTDDLGKVAKIKSRGYVAKAELNTDSIVLTTSITPTQAFVSPIEVPWIAITHLTIDRDR